MANIIKVSDEHNILTENHLHFDERLEQLKKLDELEKQKSEDNKKSPFSRWTQFNNEHTKELILLAMKHPKAHAILYFLVDQMDKYNACICSMKVIEEVIGVSRQTISKNIKILKDLGFIAVFKSGTSNVYTINDKIYWKSWGNNRKYSKFPANIILTLSEQEEFEKVKIEKHIVLKKNS